MPHRTRNCLQKPSHDIIEEFQLYDTSPRNHSGTNSLFNRSRIVNPASFGSAFICLLGHRAISPPHCPSIEYCPPETRICSIPKHTKQTVALNKNTCDKISCHETYSTLLHIYDSHMTKATVRFTQRKFPYCVH